MFVYLIILTGSNCIEINVLTHFERERVVENAKESNWITHICDNAAKLVEESNWCAQIYGNKAKCAKMSNWITHILLAHMSEPARDNQRQCAQKKAEPVSKDKLG